MGLGASGLNCGIIESHFRKTLFDLLYADLSDGLRASGQALKEKWSGRRGSNSQLSAWESKLSLLYFQYLQSRSEKMCVHALHTVHAVPEMRVAAGRLRDGVSRLVSCY